MNAMCGNSMRFAILAKVTCPTGGQLPKDDI